MTVTVYEHSTISAFKIFPWPSALLPTVKCPPRPGWHKWWQCLCPRYESGGERVPVQDAGKGIQRDKVVLGSETEWDSFVQSLISKVEEIAFNGIEKVQKNQHNLALVTTCTRPCIQTSFDCFTPPWTESIDFGQLDLSTDLSHCNEFFYQRAFWTSSPLPPSPLTSTTCSTWTPTTPFWQGTLQT